MSGVALSAASAEPEQLHGRLLQEVDGAALGGVLGAFFAFLFVFLLIFLNSFYIVRQAEGMIIERFGKFHKVMYSGWNWVFPFIDQPRSITWRKTQIGVGGNLEDQTIEATRIDLRESMFNFMKQEVYTRDTVLLDVNSLMFYRIFDIKKAAYEVEDLQSALSNTAQTQLKEVFGKMTFSEALASQRAINDHLVQQFSKLFLGWGIHVERMELLDLVPKSIGEAMKKQMIAERQRRGDFIISEGKKSAMKLEAEGSMKVQINMGIAEQQKTRKISEGEKDAKIELARAERTALDELGNAMREDKVRQSDYMLSQRYNDLVYVCADVSDKTIYLPYEAASLGGIINTLHLTYGQEGPRTGPPKRVTTSQIDAQMAQAESAAAAGDDSALD
mmetsp:Transcript_11302/g.33518  ORF Transcript_11302/g.33518 Transcript_11302/m.33518 type:complete len:389 (-) Transcript_11302:179-1345(-)